LLLAANISSAERRKRAARWDFERFLRDLRLDRLGRRIGGALVIAGLLMAAVDVVRLIL
jgi:hypothetical protein